MIWEAIPLVLRVKRGITLLEHRRPEETYATAQTGAYTQCQVRTNKDFRLLHKDAHLRRVLLNVSFILSQSYL